MTYARTILIEVGDWSDDGHGKTSTQLYTLRTSRCCDNVTAEGLIARGCELFGVGDPRGIYCQEYEDCTVPVSFLEAIAPLPFYWNDGDEYEATDYENAENNMVERGVRIGTPEWFDILVRLIERAASEDYGTTSIELVKGEWVRGGGYGLFC